MRATENTPVMERYFYHSFPRRGAATAEAIDKGCKILTSIKDSGLLLVPEYIEWRQPTSGGGQPRIFPVLQKRVCFTELCPNELPQHARKFGQFALEFEIDTLRRLGAIPVFYIPRPTEKGLDGNGVGVALLGCTMDAGAIIHRLAYLDQTLNGSSPVAEQFNFSVGFAGSPNGMGDFKLDSAEAKNFLCAVGHGATPWAPLSAGIAALLNFFYPADNVKHDKLLDFYRQREWRIACAFAINGIQVLRAPTPNEKATFLEIDPEYFGRNIQTDMGPVNMLDNALIHPGLNGKKTIEMVRRVIVPTNAIDRVTDILANLSHPPQVISTDDLGA